MIERFQGDDGHRRLLATIAEQKLVAYNDDLSQLIAARAELLEFGAGHTIITQGESTTDVYLIISGSVEIQVNNIPVANRFSGEHIGEMAAIDPSQSRTATVIARECSVLLKISEQYFIEIANKYPDVWKRVAITLSRRLEQRNRLISNKRDKVKVFIMSSVEAIPVSNLVVKHFEHDKFLTIAWQHGVFKASYYALDDLEAQLDDSDFAIAIAYSDDVVVSRDEEWPTIRDNVIFELGMFIGRLGRRRAFLLEPRGENIKLPSDLAGLTTIPYCFERGKDAEAKIAPACIKLRDLILEYGAK